MKDHPVREVSLLAGAWLGSVTLSQVSLLVSICTGVAVLVYTIVRTYFLIRNRGEK